MRWGVRSACMATIASLALLSLAFGINLRQGRRVWLASICSTVSGCVHNLQAASESPISKAFDKLKDEKAVSQAVRQGVWPSKLNTVIC